MADTGCFSCSHHCVCKHFAKWEDRFPYKNDDKISGYLKGMSDTLSSACAYFAPNTDFNLTPCGSKLTKC
jgi:hypothetical protein